MTPMPEPSTHYRIGEINRTEERHMDTHRKILVNADALARLLERVASAGFMSNELGICYVDDGSGVARRIEAKKEG